MECLPAPASTRAGKRDTGKAAGKQSGQKQGSEPTKTPPAEDADMKDQQVDEPAALATEPAVPDAGSPPAVEAVTAELPAAVTADNSNGSADAAAEEPATAANQSARRKRRKQSSVSGSTEPEAAPTAAADEVVVEPAYPSDPPAAADTAGIPAAETTTTADVAAAEPAEVPAGPLDSPTAAEAGTPAAATATGAAGEAGTSAAAEAAAADAAVNIGDTGLATNLTDADCAPNTAEFAAAKAKNDETLQKYQHRVRQYTSQNRAKPDMIAFKELRMELTPTIPIHGHIPGVKVLDEFSGRGELAILGLHTGMMRGIMAYRERGPAYAICLAGGYKDDADEGSTFWYTGQGGQNRGKQVKDQSLEGVDNAALVENAKTKTPVRVFRGKAADRGGKVERKYVYEGLYRVTDYKMEASQDGPVVCKFKMEAIPGHSAVSGKVDFRLFNKNPFAVKNLANSAGRPKAGSKRGRSLSVKEYSRQELEEMIEKRAASGADGRLVSKDLAVGKEKIPIPVWNDKDDDDNILLPEGDGEVPEFMYIQDYKFGEVTAKKLAVEAEQKFSDSCSTTCGIEFGGGRIKKNFVNYTTDGLVMCTHPCGIMECDQDCRCFRQCKNNHVVTKGLRYPLEVYKVSEHKRWGVRCVTDLPIGAVVCCYIGLVITDEWADQLRNQDLYLFDLNHFQQLAEAEERNQLPNVEMNPNLPELPEDLKHKHLVIDAHRQGNIGRFINHSCDPNCLVQTVFAGYARSQLLYYIAIVALTDIPRFTELTYDYGYSQGNFEMQSSQGEGQNVRINCTCGAQNCSGRLI